MRSLDWAKAKNTILFFGMIFVFAQIFTAALEAQTRRKTTPTTKKKVPAKPKPTVDTNLPKVTQIDESALKNLLKREGENSKPLLINFWATWCEPCREEFPDLVKIDADYKGKIDFITISLDYLSEIGRDVPKFLSEMKAEMPAYLLKTQDEDAAIALVSKNWQGSLPFTILFDPAGKEVFSLPKKIKPEILRAEIDRILAPKIVQTSIVELPKPEIRSAEDGKSDAEIDIAKGFLKIKRYGLTIAIPPADLQELKEKYGIEVVETGCVLVNTSEDYFIAYNKAMKTEILNNFGAKVLAKVSF